MVSISTSTLGVLDTPERQNEYLLTAGMLECAVGGRGNSMATVTTWFKPEYISDTYLRSIYLAAVKLVAEGAPVNALELRDRLPLDGTIFGSRLAELEGFFRDAVGYGTHILYYARKVYDAYRRIAGAGDIRSKAEELAASHHPDDVLESLPQIRSKYAPAPQDRCTEHRGDYNALIARLESGEEQAFARFGMHILDSRVQLRPGVLCTIAAPTSGGKSVLIGQSVLMAALRGRPALLFSYEMPHIELVPRWSSYLTRATFHSSNHKQCVDGMGKLAHMEANGLIKTFDDGRLDVEGIAATATAVAAVSPIALIAVDYIQIVPATKLKDATREREVSHVANSLKRLAMDLQVPVVTASQLNDDGRLRESRDIANASDIVLKLDPVDRYAFHTTDVRVSILKNRSGATAADLTAFWEKQIYRMRDKDASDLDNYDPTLGEKL